MIVYDEVKLRARQCTRPGANLI